MIFNLSLRIWSFLYASGSQLQNPSLLNGPVTRDLRSATDVHPVAYEQIILKVIFVIQVIQYSFLKWKKTWSDLSAPWRALIRDLIFQKSDALGVAFTLHRNT